MHAAASTYQGRSRSNEYGGCMRTIASAPRPCGGPACSSHAAPSAAAGCSQQTSASGSAPPAACSPAAPIRPAASAARAAMVWQHRWAASEPCRPAMGWAASEPWAQRTAERCRPDCAAMPRRSLRPWQPPKAGASACAAGRAARESRPWSACSQRYCWHFWKECNPDASNIVTTYHLLIQATSSAGKRLNSASSRAGSIASTLFSPAVPMDDIRP